MTRPSEVRAAVTKDVTQSSRLEWLDTDGRGGYASGTIAGLPTRRYHAILLVARHPPHERIVLVNHLTEHIETPAGRFALSTCKTEPEEDGARYCVSFDHRPCPTWTYEVGGVVVERSIARLHLTDDVIVRWRVVVGTGPIRIHVRPMLSGRHDHDAQRAGDRIDTEATHSNGNVSWQPHDSFPRVYAHHDGRYRHAPEWRHGIEYPIDRERGEASVEDWWSPGEVTLDVAPGASAAIRLSITPAHKDVEGAFQREMTRRGSTESGRSESLLFDTLCVAARSYHATFEGGAAVLAGFPWFDVWTRDTFTAFTGLYLATERYAEGRAVLATFAPLVQHGMLPANLPDAVTKPRWNAADASFWFIISLERYFEATGDASAIDDFGWKAVRAIIEGHCAGEVPHVRIAADGLVFASAPDQALTWMDADYKGKVMTPRRGKPVEIQALWIKSLDVARTMAERRGETALAAKWSSLRSAAIASFQARFWNEAKEYLYDVIDGPDGDDASLRPNQIFALTLDPALVPPDRAMRVLDVVRKSLVTPLGLRSLAPDDPHYHAHYEGPQSKRDPAYHQGTAWPFLLGPFVSAWVRLHGRTAEAREEGRSFLRRLEEQIEDENCIGHFSEIFDADAPHEARGCFAQAWSAGEVLAALHYDLRE